jgi:TPR repeat protein
MCIYRDADQKSSKAIHYYNEVIKHDKEAEENIVAQIRGEKLQTNDDSDDTNADRDYISNALFELSSLLEEDPASIDVADEAFHLLVRAAGKGHTEAQHNLAAAYATGINNGMVPMDPGRSLLLEYMAALGGDPLANMAMGYRFLNGIGVPESCEKAQVFYEYAANEAAEQIRKRGYPLYSERALLSDIELANAKGRREIDPEVRSRVGFQCCIRTLTNPLFMSFTKLFFAGYSH